jgi:D-glycero-D-manno-heptose 1,7-bisphosphate phosphatase
MVDLPARFLDAEGVWCQVLPGACRGGGALFLDRDGVVNVDPGYVGRPEDVTMIAGAGQVIAAANARRIPVVLVTNQAGIARRRYGWDGFAAVQEAILDALARDGARVDAVYACAHHPQGQPPYAHPDHPARKPNPGMLLRAAADLDLELGRSWLIGDKAIDVEAARRAGLAGVLHVLTGHGREERPAVLAMQGGGLEIRLGESIRDALLLLPLLVHA